jgi:hypothetical protein
MSAKGLEARTTFEIARELVEILRKLDDLVRGPAWWKPCRYRQRTCIDKASKRCGDLTSALIDRYRGVFTQIYNGLQQRGSHPNRSFGEFFDTWWSNVETPLMGARSTDQISSCLWQSAEFAANVSFGDDSSIGLLKPKFMLRPLVDEIKNVDKRRLLLSMAYDPAASSAVNAFSAAEQFGVATASCEALYDVLSALSDRLMTLTCGAVEASLLKDHEKAVRQLRHWLFGAW